MKILLAEDDLNISTIASFALENIGNHTVTVVNDGETALAIAQEEKFDLILLDEMMPKMNGLSVCRNYLKLNINHAPIIFLSAKSQEDDINEFKKWGLGFIPKPFEPTQLCQSIDELLSKATKVDGE